MKKISLPTDLLVALAQLEDKDLSQMMRAIITYASEGSVPSFSNVALKAFFSLFRSAIDEQRSASEKMSAINRDNAKSKKSPSKKKRPGDSQPSAPIGSEPLTLESIEAVYPKLGSFRTESLDIWSQFSDDTRKRAIDFVTYYLAQHPDTADRMYLNQYLKSEIWGK